MQLRSARLEDAVSIARLHIASWRVAYRDALPADYLASLDEAARAEQWRTRLARQTTQVLVAERSNELLGFCAHGPAAPWDDTLTSAWEIYGLHVRPDLRGLGLGTLLFNAGLQAARRADVPFLTLWVVATNAAARRFYERKGMYADGLEKARELAPGILLQEVHYRTELERAVDSSLSDRPA